MCTISPTQFKRWSTRHRGIIKSDSRVVRAKKKKRKETASNETKSSEVRFFSFLEEHHKARDVVESWVTFLARTASLSLL